MWVWDEYKDYDADAFEFYQPDSHKKNVFRMKNFCKHVETADPVIYADNKTWFDNRSTCY